MEDSLKHIEINIGNVCNNRCIFCMNDGVVHKFAPLEDVKREIESHAALGYRSIGFIGGEPTIHPHIIDYIAYAKSVGFQRIHLVSNGRRYSDIAFLRKLIESGATRFSVSVHSHLPEVEDRLTCAKGGFEQKLLGIKNLMECQRSGAIKYKVCLSMVVNRTNYRSLKAFMEFFNGLGVSEFRFNVMRPEGRAMSNFSELGIRYSGLAPEIIDSIEYAKKRGIGLTVDCLPKCIADTSEIPDEFMGEPKDYFDRIVSFSNSKKKAFSWKEKIKNELKTKPKSCKKCVFDDSCDGVWRGYIERFGSGEFKPVRNVQSGDL